MVSSRFELIHTNNTRNPYVDAANFVRDSGRKRVGLTMYAKLERDVVLTDNSLDDMHVAATNGCLVLAGFDGNKQAAVHLPASTPAHELKEIAERIFSHVSSNAHFVITGVPSFKTGLRRALLEKVKQTLGEHGVNHLEIVESGDFPNAVVLNSKEGKLHIFKGTN